MHCTARRVVVAAKLKRMPLIWPGVPASLTDTIWPCKLQALRVQDHGYWGLGARPLGQRPKEEGLVGLLTDSQQVFESLPRWANSCPPWISDCRVVMSEQWVARFARSAPLEKQGNRP